MDSELQKKAEETGSTEEKSYWKRIVKRYEKRNASLERRRDALVERVRFMECALPSLLMGAAVVNTKRAMPDSMDNVSSNPTSVRN